MSFRDPSEEKIVENFLEEEGVEENMKSKILKIVRGMGEFVGIYVTTSLCLLSWYFLRERAIIRVHKDMSNLLILWIPRNSEAFGLV